MSDMDYREPNSPEPEEVFQEEPTQAEEYSIKAVPVSIEGPVNVRELPAVQWSTFGFDLNTSAGAVRLLNANPLRKRAVIAASNSSLYICDSSAKARVSTTPQGLRIPAGTNAVITHTQEVWAITSSDGNTITGFEEFWTN